MSGTANNPEDARAWSVDFAGDASQQPFGAGVEGSEPGSYVTQPFSRKEYEKVDGNGSMNARL